jgi:hypothetical protein
MDACSLGIWTTHTVGEEDALSKSSTIADVASRTSTIAPLNRVETRATRQRKKLISM